MCRVVFYSSSTRGFNVPGDYKAKPANDFGSFTAPSNQPTEVPEVSGIPLKSLDDLKNLEESIATQENKERLVGEIVALFHFFLLFH